MRALPSLSLEYFGSTALGNTAGPAGAAGAAAGAASFLASFFGAAGAGAAAVGAGAAAGVASAPHWALRKSFHFWPASVPADLAAWYFALHSCAVRACAGEVAIAAANPAAAAAHNNFKGMVILGLPTGALLESRILAQPGGATTRRSTACQKYSGRTELACSSTVQLLCGRENNHGTCVIWKGFSSICGAKFGKA